jgi:uncharacterized protein YceK
MDTIMNTPNYLKSKLSSVVSLLMVLGLMAGCASVTDANADEPATSQVTAVDKNLSDEETSTDNDPIWFNSNGDDMDPIIDRPDTGGTYYD